MKTAIILSLLFWVFVLWCCGVVKAEDLTVMIDRSRYMRRSVAVEIARSAVRAQPVRVAYRIRTSPRNFCYSVEGFYTGLQLACYRNARRGIRGRVLFLSEPLIQDGIIYTGGRAELCKSWGTGVCNVTEKNSANLDRIMHGAWACTHELGHLLGARHDLDLYNECPSIMHPAPLPFVGLCPLSFSDRSRNQILACNYRSKK